MMKPWVIKFMSFWPPFVGAGIRVKHVADDYRRIEVQMKLRFYNRNFVGTHFGGSLFAMTDPFLMLMLLQNLGRDYIVWDKASSIRFRKPGKGVVKAIFELSEDKINELKVATDQNGKIEPIFHVEIKDEAGEVVASLEKTVYIRKKDSK